MTDQHQAALLGSSKNFVEAKSAFTNAILAAERDGMDLGAIARVTGLSLSMIRAVLKMS
jgi:hypothetical protein